MKKLILLFMAACLSFGANAQIRSVGLSVGAFEGVSMQHWVYGTENLFQLDLGYHTGVPYSGSIRLSGTYNITFLSPDWTTEGQWNLYAGPGAYLGGGWATGKGLVFGVMAIVGVEYIFDSIPLQLSADMRPAIGTVLTNDEFIFDKDGLLGFAPTVSVRYLF